MEKWKEPELIELGVESTKENATTFDYPHYMVCQVCGRHQTLEEVIANNGYCIAGCGSKDIKFSLNPGLS